MTFQRALEDADIVDTVQRYIEAGVPLREIRQRWEAQHGRR